MAKDKVNQKGPKYILWVERAYAGFGRIDCDTAEELAKAIERAKGNRDILAWVPTMPVEVTTEVKLGISTKPSK